MAKSSIRVKSSGGGSAPIEVANYSALPAVGSAPGTTYIALASQGTWWTPGSIFGTYYPAGYYYDATTEYIYSKTPSKADQTTVDAGVVDDQFVTPKTLLERVVKYLQFNTTDAQTRAVAKLIWNDTDGTLEFGLKGGNVNLQIGQEQVVRVVNKTGADLLESQYKAVRLRTVSEGGASGQKLAIKLAEANSEINSSTTIGLVTENISNNQEGFITILGNINDVNTTGSLQSETWSDGDMLFLSPTVAGGITNVEPTGSYHTVVIGYVVYAHAIQGKIFVKVDNGYELDELHDVSIPSTPSNNDGLFYDLATSLWKNKSIVTALGYTPIPNTRTVNGKVLSSDITLNSSDIGAPSGTGTSSGTNTGDETQSSILSKLGWWQYNRITETASYSGTSEMIIENILIPANTYLLGGILRLYNLKVRKVGGVGATTAMRIYIGPNSNNLSGATQIAIFSSSIASNVVTIEMLRTFTATTTGLLGFASTSSVAVDTGTGTVARSSTAVDWTVNQYIMITIIAASGSDSYSMIGASAKNF